MNRRKIVIVADGEENLEIMNREDVQAVFKSVAEKHGVDLQVSYDDGLSCEGDTYIESVLKVETNGPGWIKHSPKFLESIKDAELIVVTFSGVDKELLDAAEKLKFVGVMRSGIENVNVKLCTERNITVSCAPGRVSEPVADFAMALICDINRGVTYCNQYWEPGLKEEFLPFAYPALMKDLTIGLVGFGIIGKKVAERLKGFGSRVIAYDPYVTQKTADEYNVTMVSLDELMKTADTVSVHARLLPETRGLIGRHEISLMKESAYFVNTARAGLVDEQALLEALREKKICGAALDVFQTEPLPDDSEFRKLKNVIVTPHLSGRAGNTPVISAEIMFEEIDRYLSGKELQNRKN